MVNTLNIRGKSIYNHVACSLNNRFLKIIKIIIKKFIYNSVCSPICSIRIPR